jgi:hypothetical protein
MKKYNLFLDDIRNPSDCLGYTRDHRYTQLKWVVVRNYNDFNKEILRRFIEGEIPEVVSFDHDLCDAHYDPSMYVSKEAYEEVSADFKEMTGKEAAMSLVNFCLNFDIPLPEIMIHTQNPIGYTRIKETIEDYRRFKKMVADEQSSKFGVDSNR